MSSLRYEPDPQQKLNARSAIILALGAVTLAAVGLGIAAHFRVGNLREAHAQEIAHLRADQIAQERRVTEAAGQAPGVAERLEELENKATQLDYLIRVEALKVQLTPSIDHVVTIKGRLRNSKTGWYLNVEKFDAPLRVETPAPDRWPVINPQLEPLQTKTITVTATLRFGTPWTGDEGDAVTLARSGALYLNPEEWKILAVE